MAEIVLSARYFETGGTIASVTINVAGKTLHDDEAKPGQARVAMARQ